MDMSSVWVDDCHICPAWIEKATGLKCESCLVEDISNKTRQGDRIQDGATLRLNLQGGDIQTLIIKQVSERDQSLSKQLGLAREALFYAELQKDARARCFSIPKVYHAEGDMVTGSKIIVMEDLRDGVDSGAFFGPGNPNNWTRDLEAQCARAPSVTAPQVAHATFVKIAQVHAFYWKDTSLLDKIWLRGQSWLQGKGRESWVASQNIIQGVWRSLNHEEPLLDRFDPKLLALLTKAMDGISWEAQQKRLSHPSTHWTLVHGDFWPGNCMWMTNSAPAKKNGEDDGGSAAIVESTEVKLLDWEMVGLGSGPQDLGQYVISNMDPTVREECELSLVQAYYDELMARKDEAISVDWEYVWSEYKIGGVERWLWFLVYFLGNPAMKDWAQFFHDQIAAFCRHHEITPEMITQPRP